MKRKQRAATNAMPPRPAAAPPSDVRTGMSVGDLQRAVTDHLCYSVGRLRAAAKPHDYYYALALAVRDRTQRAAEERLEPPRGACHGHGE